MKYWSCCQKKTTDFQVFLDQKGCATGTHLWDEPNETIVKTSCGRTSLDCRYDWHQTGTQVIVVVYAKEFSPELSTVLANGVKLSINLEFPGKKEYFAKDFLLSGVL